MGDRTYVSSADFAAEGLVGWSYGSDTVRARFLTGDFARGVNLVRAIAEVADEVDHHPDIDLRYTHIDVVLTSHDVGHVTLRDIHLARSISAIATAHGIATAPEHT